MTAKPYPLTSWYSEALLGNTVLTDMSKRTGRYFFVHSGTGSDTAGAGYTPSDPAATIDYPIVLCAASKGDTIIVMPGHSEDITTATAIALDVIGVRIVGIGSGALMPTVNMTAAEGSVTVSVASVTIKNIKFVAVFATGVTRALTLPAGADDFTLDGCLFVDTAVNQEFLVHADVATTVDRMKIINNRFVGAAGTMSGSFVFAGTTLDMEIADNYWFVDSSDSVIHHDAGIASNVYMHDNVIQNVDTDTAEYCAEFKTTSTGSAHDNRFGYNKNDAEVWKGDAMWWSENYMSNTIAEGGFLEPANSSDVP